MDRPNSKPVEVLYNVCQLLNSHKDVCECPIFVMSQLKPHSRQNTEFEDRIKERRQILVNATCALEIIPDKENGLTNWKIWKSRFSNTSGKSVPTQFLNGRYKDLGGGTHE